MAKQSNYFKVKNKLKMLKENKARREASHNRVRASEAAKRAAL